MEDLSGLSPAVINTITEARVPTTMQLYALKWHLFSAWCSSGGEDPQRISYNPLGPLFSVVGSIDVFPERGSHA